MLKTLHDEAILPCKYVVADCLSGNSAAFLDAVERDVDLVYVVAIPADTRAWLQGPVMETKPYRYGGEVRTKRQVVAKDRTPPSVAATAHSLPDACWYRRTVSEGTTGPIEYALTKRRVTLCREGLPERNVWLVMKRTLGGQPSYWYDISNAPLRSRLPLVVWLSGVRWAIEQGFEASKTALGMDHYEVRKYPGWHPHRLTSMLAHVFLWHLKIRVGEKSASADGVAATEVACSGVTSACVYD
jgi:SRSO17 transposase